MVKADRKDVYIGCYGNIRGCLVNHCNIAGGCIIRTLELERDMERARVKK